MKTNVLSNISKALGAGLLAAAAMVAILGRNAAPKLLSVPDQARMCTEALVQALNRGDLEAAGESLYEPPALENHPEFDSPVTAALWDAWRESLRCSFTQGFSAGENGLCRQMDVTMLDLSALLDRIRDRYETILPELAREAGAEAKSAEGGYHQDFVVEVLDTATRQVLEEDCPTTTCSLRLELIYRDNRWWIRPDGDLGALFAGELAMKEG